VPATPSAQRPRIGPAVWAAVVLWIVLTAPGARAATSYCLGEPATIKGTPGNDWIYATTHADVVALLSGADRVYGRAGDDRLCGGQGQDVLLDGTGADQIDGGDGSDTLYLCPDRTPDRWFNVERVVVSDWACR
jgi:hemolysin type calcium-binding protein